jgi:hypothetical protein
LQSLGVCTELTVKTGGDHGVYDETHAQDVFRVSRASCFFKSLFCNDCSSAYLLDSNAANCSALGYIDRAQLAAFDISPNPCNGKFTITLDRSYGTIMKIDIYNMLGEIIYSVSPINTQNSCDMDLSMMPKGLYVINLNNGTHHYTKKILIQ